MPLLIVGLKQGFSHDEVSIRINGGEVFHKRDVTSKLATSYADEWTGTVEPQARVEIELPRKSLCTCVEVEQSTCYIAVSVDGNDLEAQQLSQITPPM